MAERNPHIGRAEDAFYIVDANIITWYLYPSGEWQFGCAGGGYYKTREEAQAVLDKWLAAQTKETVNG